jgi:hypothetical protein
VPPEREEAWRDLFAQAWEADPSLPVTRLGRVTSAADLVIQQMETVLLHLPVVQLREAYEQAIPRRMRQAGPPPDR